MALLQFTDRGIWCEPANVYIDPWQPVDRALISHGHADHATPGHRHYLTSDAAAPVIRHRLGLSGNLESVFYGQTVSINGVEFSFHPAGHIPGSAQIRVAYHGEAWVFTGDYKLQDDQLSAPFELLRCHVLITESTFGLPVYKWKDASVIFDDINGWWRRNQEEGRASVLAGYALGKAQRILKHVDHGIGKVFTHGAVDRVNEVLRRQGIDLPMSPRVTDDIRKDELQRALIICPPSAVGSAWMRRFYPYSLGVASGWMKLRGTRRRRGADRGFALSDHADWNDLQYVVKASGAERVFVTHGYAGIFARWLNEQGIQAHEVRTRYEGELGEMAEGSPGESSSDEVVG